MIGSLARPPGLRLFLPAHHPVGTMRPASFATHAGRTIVMNMNRQAIQYKGYEVAPVAQQLPNGLFAANLTIGKATAAPSPAHSFDLLDYFFDHDNAVQDVF